MAIRTVLRMGDARLMERSVEVDARAFGTRELLTLISDMRDTMRAYSGVGLAAPQIGVGLRLVIFGFQSSPRYPDAEPVPDTVLINPVITPVKLEQEDGWEGCLSLPGLRGMVPRFTAIRYQGFDEHGAGIDRTVSSFHARVVQHECDHLDGVLYPMRMRDFSQFGYNDVLFPDDGLPEE